MTVIFPVISSLITDIDRQSMEKAINACTDFINDNSDYSINIIFAVLSDESKLLGEKTIDNI